MIKVFNVIFTVGRNAEAIIFLKEMKKQVSFIFVYFITYLNHKIDDKLNYLKITKCTKTCTHVIQFFFTRFGTVLLYILSTPCTS